MTGELIEMSELNCNYISAILLTYLIIVIYKYSYFNVSTEERHYKGMTFV